MINKIFGLDTDFKQIFFRNEFDTLKGKASRGIYALALILFFTLAALSFAIGGYKYLSKRMSNPFTNWVNLRMTRSVDEQKDNIVEMYGSSSAREAFGLKKINTYQLYYAPFIDANLVKRDIKGSTIDDNSEELLTEILRKDNLLRTNDLTAERKDAQKVKLIVTEKFLQDLSLPLSTEYVTLDLSDDDDPPVGKKWVELPIEHVVKALPNLIDFIAAVDVYQLYNSQYNSEGNSNTLRIISPLSEEQILDYVEKSDALYSVKSSTLGFTGKSRQQLHRLTLKNFIDDDAKNRVIEDLNKATSTQSRRHYYPDDFDSRSSFFPTDLAFIFANTKNVRSFSDSLRSTNNVEIDMSQIESKENFALVSRLTRFVSFALFILSLLSIIFFIDSILKTHLEKSKTNLGTFKAFGLDNKFLTGIYLKIIINFLMLALGLALLLVGIIVAVEQMINGTQSLLDLFNPLILVAILSLVIFVYLYSKKTIDKILSHTPGDLIYRRV